MAQDHNHGHGCGCNSIFIELMENAGKELTRRDFVKSAAAAAGIMAIGDPAQAESGAKKTAKSKDGADAIYHGGPILTMVKDQERVEALAVKNGKIVAAGTKAEVMAVKNEGAKVVDLGGKCLMPGFIDPPFPRNSAIGEIFHGQSGSQTHR